MKRAILYEEIGQSRVRCLLCANQCVIAEGERGICAVRENRNGTLYTLVYGNPVVHDADPIEKKPFFHFFPGTMAYSIATVGCNFNCLNCQNHYISQYPREHDGEIIELDSELPPSEIVSQAKQQGCNTIAYTYTEPTVFFEYALDTARLAHEEGLHNVFVSNGYMSAPATEQIAPYLDAINIDLKGITEEFYREVARGNLRPVLNSIERMFHAGVWVEVTTLVIPSLNDQDDTLRWIAEAIYGISPAIPWHISRFSPTYKLNELRPTPITTLERAREIGADVGLRYIYIGNVPGEGEDTYCPNCSTRLIKRSGFIVRENKVRAGKCPNCAEPIDGVWFMA